MEGNIDQNIPADRSPWQAWGQHIAVAAAYVAVYQIIRELSNSQWIMTANLRLACLLFMPTRLWPALGFGEWLGITPGVLECMKCLGTTWGISAMMPHIVLCMPFMKFVRQHWSLYDREGNINMTMLLGSAMAGAFATASASGLTVYIAVAQDPVGLTALGESHYFLRYLLSGYLTTVIVLPAALALRDHVRRTRIALPWRIPLLRDALLWLPGLAGLCVLAANTPGGVALMAVRLAMISPALMLARRHGWQGAAWGGLIGGLAMWTTTPETSNEAMVQAKIVFAIVMSCLLTYGARPLRGLSVATARQPI